MNSRIRKLILGWILLVTLLTAIAGCGGTATPAPAPHTATPTSLPVATSTPLPSPTATAPPTAVATPSPTRASPRRVTFKPGQVVDVKPGIFFTDITTGAIEGWQLPLDATGHDWANQVAMASISPDGRFILYPAAGTRGNWGVWNPPERDAHRTAPVLAAGTLGNWREWGLLDTQTGKTCTLPDVRDWAGAFSPDGQTFLANTAHGIARLRFIGDIKPAS